LTTTGDSGGVRALFQTWSEALRDPVLHHRVRQLYVDTLGHITELARRWRANGCLPADADAEAVAVTFLSTMLSLIVMHRVVDDVPAATLQTGLALLGVATQAP